MKDKEKQNISMKEMLTKRSIEPITNCNCVKDKEKQIIEKAIDILYDLDDFYKSLTREQLENTIKRGSYYDAVKLVKLGYRKISEDSVVLSREEYDELKAENDKYVKDCINYLATINKLENKVWELEQQSSNEKLEKMINFMKAFFDSWEDTDKVSKATMIGYLKVVAREFEVEIKE